MQDDYVRKGKVIKVVDGDTVRMAIDLGFNTARTENLRLWGIDSPELRGESRIEGLKAKEFLSSLLWERNDIWIQSFKTDKYGRYVAKIWRGLMFINETMVENGHAVWREDYKT